MVKPLHAKWIVKYYDYAKSKPEIIINGWKESGITENLEKKINLDTQLLRNIIPKMIVH